MLIPLVFPRPALFRPLATLNAATKAMKREMPVLVVAAKVAESCEASVAVVVDADEAVFGKSAEYRRLKTRRAEEEGLLNEKSLGWREGCGRGSEFIPCATYYVQGIRFGRLQG